jgi:two-component system nitrogen regulation response regulator NtrX
MKTVLIVDDEIDIQSSLSFALKDEGYEVISASSPMEAEKILSQSEVHVGLFDVWFPEGDGMELLKLTRERFPHISVIMMSGHGNIELALKSVRLGAYDFIEKPLELEKVLVILRNATVTMSLRVHNQLLSDQIFEKHQLVGDSPAMQSLKAQLQKQLMRVRRCSFLARTAAVKKLSQGACTS